MKINTHFRPLIFVLFFFFAQPLLAQISGLQSVFVSSTETYSFYTGIDYSNPDWVVTNGAIQSSWAVGTTYYVSVNWPTSGAASVSFTDFGNAEATLSVSVSACANVYTVGGGGSYCSPGAGVSITLSGSEVGLNYELN
ncbi:MAG: hypothetical protein ABL925_18185, partial [Methylococcales bacterium]